MGHDQRSARGAWCSPSRTPASSSPRSSVATLAEPFLRGTERIRTDHAGVGLGLAIVKSITQAHDGTLTLTPRAAGGLRVTVQLPAAPSDPDSDPKNGRQRARSRWPIASDGSLTDLGVHSR